MCTVIIRVPEDASEPTRLVAIRDEDPARPWNPLGEWWPERPGVLGVRDVRAGGAWLAADPAARRLAVLLNRADDGSLPDAAAVSRGTLPLESVAGRAPASEPRTRGFNLLEVTPDETRVVSWDGVTRRAQTLLPGTHMIAHDDVDDTGTARISQWLERFRGAEPADGPEWERPWLDVLTASTALGPADDRAIIRDNTVHGYPTLSLLVCAATVGPAGVDVRYADLPAPAVWGELHLH